MNKKVKGFVTWKCRKCNNVMRQEYAPIREHKPCSICGSDKWIQIKMNEVGK